MENGGKSAGETEKAEEGRVLGVDLESVPFVVLAALGSLGLAAAAWRWPASVPVLAVIAVVMLVSAGLGVREVVHQSNESRAGLAILAAAVGLLRVVAAVVAAAMARAASAKSGSPGPAEAS